MIKIVTKDFCPYCSMAKKLIKDLGFDYEEIDLSDDAEKMHEIMNISGMMTVPQIFVGEIKQENLLGGYSDISKLHNDGKLVGLFKEGLKKSTKEKNNLFC